MLDNQQQTINMVNSSPHLHALFMLIQSADIITIAWVCVRYASTCYFSKIDLGTCMKLLKRLGFFLLIIQHMKEPSI